MPHGAGMRRSGGRLHRAVRVHVISAGDIVLVCLRECRGGGGQRERQRASQDEIVTHISCVPWSCRPATSPPIRRRKPACTTYSPWRLIRYGCTRVKRRNRDLRSQRI